MRVRNLTESAVNSCNVCMYLKKIMSAYLNYRRLDQVVVYFLLLFKAFCITFLVHGSLFYIGTPLGYWLLVILGAYALINYMLSL